MARSKNEAIEVAGEVLTGNPVDDRLTIPALRINVSLDSNTTATAAMAAVDSICVGIDRQTRGLSALRVILGRILSEIHRRKLYRPLFATFEAYTTMLDGKYGLTRTTLRDALRVVQVFPDLEPEQAEAIRLTNLNLVTKVVADAEKNNGGMVARDRKMLLGQAAKLSVVDFKEKLQGNGLILRQGRPEGGHRTSGTVSLRILCSARVAQSFRKNAGEEDQGKYLERLMALDKAGARNVA